MNITSAQVAPNPVYTGGSVYVSVEVADPNIWLLDSNENFLIDSNGAYLLAAKEE